MIKMFNNTKSKNVIEFVENILFQQNQYFKVLTHVRIIKGLKGIRLKN